MNFSISKAFNLFTDKVELWLVNFSASLPNILVSLLIIIIFWVIAKIAKKTVLNVLLRFSQNVPVANLMAGVTQTIVIISGIFIGLGVLNLDKTVSSLLAGAGIVGLAIGFAFQEIASNFIAGVLISFRKPFKIGDIVKVNDYEGRISDIDLRTTRLATFDGLEVIIPNKDMFTNPVTNYTATEPRRVELEIGVSYAENLRSVREITLKALENVGDRVKDKEPEVFFTSFDDSSINFKARVWITHSDQKSKLAALNDIVILVKEAFDQNNIMIPFPIRTLDFGIKGGEKLTEILAAQSLSKD